MNSHRKLSLTGMIIGIVSAYFSFPLGIFGIWGIILISHAKLNQGGSRAMNIVGLITSCIGISGFVLGCIWVIFLAFYYGYLPL